MLEKFSANYNEYIDTVMTRYSWNLVVSLCDIICVNHLWFVVDHLLIETYIPLCSFIFCKVHKTLPSVETTFIKIWQEPKYCYLLVIYTLVLKLGTIILLVDLNDA